MTPARRINLRTFFSVMAIPARRSSGVVICARASVHSRFR